MAHHGANRGAGTAIFFGQADASELPAYDGSWERFFHGYSIPQQVTTYACESFSFPTDKDRHVVALRPINVTKYNHHAILHICVENDFFQQHDTPELCSYHPSSNPNPGNGQGSSPLGPGAHGWYVRWTMQPLVTPQDLRYLTDGLTG